MRNLLRKLRGLVGNGIVWAAAWAVGTLIFSLVPALLSGALTPSWVFGLVLAKAAVVGFGSGAVFSLVLGVAYRNRLLDDIRTVPMGILGTAAGLLIPVALFIASSVAGVSFPPTVVATNLTIAGLLGMGTSLASLRLARDSRPVLSGSKPDGRLAAG